MTVECIKKLNEKTLFFREVEVGCDKYYVEEIDIFEIFLLSLLVFFYFHFHNLSHLLLLKAERNQLFLSTSKLKERKHF